MNQKFTNVLMFAAGAAIGSLVTWKLVKTRYEQIAQEEINSVKETWSRLARESESKRDAGNPECENSETSDEDEDDDEDDESDDVQYYNLVNRYRSAGMHAEIDEEGEGDDEAPYINGPQVISPEEFADGTLGHDIHSITYYADGVLADDWNVILDIDETIGDEAIEHFGDYVEDVVHVRNERLHADYEVVRDCRKYADVLASNPHTRAYAD